MERFPFFQLKLLLELLIAPLMILVPKDRRKVVFGAWKGKQFACNPKYLFEYVVKRGGFKCVWIGNRELEPLVKKMPGAVFARKGSLKAFWHAITAWTYVFNIMWEDDIIRFPRYGRVNLIYVTHGYCDKKVGRHQYSGNGSPPVMRRKKFQQLRNIQRWIVSRLYRTVSWCSESSEMCVNLRYEGQQVELHKDRMLRFGHPRADYFIHNATSESEIKRQKAKYAKILGLPEDQKWYLFAPTWRHDSKYLYSFSLSSRKKEIEHILASQNAILIEKQHPIVLETMKFDVDVMSPVRIISKDEARLIDTQELLMACDRLITDYSSIYFDFVLMNRPVIHYTYDYDHLMNVDFGFCYDMRLYGGGPFAYEEGELLKFLSMDDEKLLAMRNAATRDQFLEYEKGNSCASYYDLLERFASSKRYFAE